MNAEGGQKSVRRVLAIAVIATLAAMVPTVAAPATASASRGHQVLPKGTPYAAEVIATVGGESHITVAETTTVFNICQSEPSVADETEDFDFTWKARYPQVTVPVADENELGRAFDRLHVRVQPTSWGTGGLTSGEFHAHGQVPPTLVGGQPAGGSDCSKQPFEEAGTYEATRPTFADITYGAFEGPRRLFEFDLGTIDTSETDISGPDPLADLDAALLDIPHPEAVLNVPPNYDSVPAEFRVDTLKRLLRKPSITVYRRTNGTHDCSLPPNDVSETKCKVEWNYQFRIKLTRRFLYRTKAAYAK